MPEDIIERYYKLKAWGVPEDVYTYIFSKNLFPLMEEIIEKTGIQESYLGTFIGHKLKFEEGRKAADKEFNYRIILRLFEFLKRENLDFKLADRMIPFLMEHPKMEFESIILTLKLKRIPKEEILARIPILKLKFAEGKTEIDKVKQRNWIMGQLKNRLVPVHLF